MGVAPCWRTNRLNNDNPRYDGFPCKSMGASYWMGRFVAEMANLASRYLT
jgi:hypothetical protein